MGLFSLAKLFGITLRESADDGSDFTNPDADHRRVFLGEDGALHLKDSSGTVTTIGGGAVATDAIWDAPGDLALGTGANTAAKLVIGTSGYVLTSNGTTAAWAAAGGVPGWLSWFTGTTDSTHFYWDGNDLAGFTAQNVSGTGTFVENGNSIQVLASNQTTDDATVQLIAQTISTGDEWILAVNTVLLGSDVSSGTGGYRGIGIVMTDGVLTTSNCVIGHLQQDNGGSAYIAILVGRTGTLTAINGAAPWVSQNVGASIGGWLFIGLKYTASNTFQLKFGPSPYQMSAFGEADISKTMTPTHIGLFATENNNAGTMLGMFGPLKKV